MRKLSHGCTLDCFDCCKFDVYVSENKVIKIEGDKDHPYTKGFICKKGLAHLERLNHEKRIYKPLLKENNKWKEISFEEAINIMVSKLKEYKDKYSSKSILYYEQYGNGSLLKSIGDIFFNFYGGVSKQKGGPCWSAGIAAQKSDFGDVKGHSLEDMLNSKSIFVWGKNPASTSIHTMQMIKKAKRNGTKVVVIDPIYTKTAEMADIHIKIKPNGDLSLALAMGKIIVEENLYDNKYISLYVNGFNEYAEYVKNLDMNKLSHKCGIDVGKIRKLVDLYNKKYSTILLGYGLQKYKNGGNIIKAIDTLGAITGQIGFSGGGVNYANKVYPSVLNLDPYTSEKYASNRYFYVSHLSDFIKNSNKETYYKDNVYVKNKDDKNLESLNIPIKMAVICKSNLLNQLPNLNELEEAFSKIEFKVCFDMFMTDTADKCDLFIPTSSTLESEDMLFSSMSNPYIIYNEKAVEPMYEEMDEYRFFSILAEKLQLENYPLVSKREYLNQVIKPLRKYKKDISLEKIRDEYITVHEEIPWKDKKFLTASGKFEIKVFEDDFKKEDENKLRLLTNHSKDTLFSQHMMDEKGNSIAYINEKMASKKGVNNGDKVKLQSKNGFIDVEIRIDNCIADNVVMMYVGWWKKHGNPNFITVSEISDIGGQVAYNESFVEIIK